MLTGSKPPRIAEGMPNRTARLPRPWPLLAIMALAVSCSDGDNDHAPTRLEQGDLAVSLSEINGLLIERGGETIWASHTGDSLQSGEDELREGDAYAAFASAKTRLRYVDEVFGFFRFRDTVDPFVALLLLVVGGGTGAGMLQGYGFPATNWSWDGTGILNGPLTAVLVGGSELPACAAPEDLDCVDGAVARLGPGSLDGGEITLAAGGDTGSLTVTSAGLSALRVELR